MSSTVSFPQYPAAATQQYPPQAAACQCAECMAYYSHYYGYQYPQAPRTEAPQPTGQDFTHSPYAYPIKPQAPSQTPVKPQLAVIPTPQRKHSSTSSNASVSSGHNDGLSDSGDETLPIQNVTVAAINQTIGRVISIASTAHGSSFLQSALKQYPMEAFEVCIAEMQSSMLKLLHDMHACYVVKALLEMMDAESAFATLAPLAANEQALIALCTKDLHSRRMVQFILDFCGADRCRYLFDLVMNRPMQLVRTQQGCITLQRILDVCSAQEKEQFFALVRSDFLTYTLDPFGNYVVQYMLKEGDQVANSDILATCRRGQVHNMVCHKYASNVIEKCFGFVTPELQHDIIEEMFMAPDFAVSRILTDSSANYVVQAAIRAASQRDIQMISQRLAPLLPTIPYGKKIQQKINRRMRH